MSGRTAAPGTCGVPPRLPELTGSTLEKRTLLHVYKGFSKQSKGFFSSEEREYQASLISVLYKYILTSLRHI